MKLLIATTNPGKIREIRLLLAGLPLDLVALPDLPPIEEPVEDGRTFLDNARKKAMAYAAATGLLTVAEDSGLEIDALGGAPGVHSSRFHGDTPYAEKFARLYAMLAERGRDSSPARFVSEAVVAAGDRILFEARGTVEGVIAGEPRGTNGFGYDPIFFHPPSGRTLAELTDEEKGALSHRGGAFRQVRAFLSTSGPGPS
jgi:XTP/dITP diphosphohydrolase